MTVRELLKHFGFYFDRIEFFNKTKHIQGNAYIYNVDSYELTIKNNDEFLNMYGDYKVIDWEVETGGSLLTKIYISILISTEK